MRDKQNLFTDKDRFFETKGRYPGDDLWGSDTVDVLEGEPHGTASSGLFIEVTEH